MPSSPFSSVDTSVDPDSLVSFLDTAAVGLGAMKRYVAYRLSQRVPGPMVLDLGCGAGHDLALLEAEGLVPVGLDTSTIMMTAASARAPGTRLVRAAGERLPFGDASFDGCRVERVLMHVADPGVVVREIARVLRPDGIVAAFEPDWASLWFESTTPDAAVVTSRLSPCRWPDIGGRLAAVIEDAGFEILDEVTEASRGTRLARIPLDIERRLERRVADGIIPGDVVAAWLAEQRDRDRTGRLRARWVKKLVVARRC